MAVKSLIRKQLKQQRAAKGEEASALLSGTHSELDRAGRKGVIPRTRVARLKSRTARQAAKAKSD
jgi:ribosomal protein S20